MPALSKPPADVITRLQTEVKPTALLVLTLTKAEANGEDLLNQIDKTL